MKTQAAAILKTVKIGRYQTALTAALILVVALLIARPAAADFVSLRLVDSRVSEKPASGFLTSSERSNIKETWNLTPQLRWGNDYLHQRYYSPVLGRFVSVDPVAGKVGASQSANRYSYVLNNPVRLVDPTGEDPLGALIGFAGGAVMGAIENIRIANRRPISQGEIFRNLGANLLGGTVTGFTAGLGGPTAGVASTTLLGGAGAAGGGIIKRGIDPSSMGTDPLSGKAIFIDAVGGSFGALAGGAGAKTLDALQSSSVEAVKIQAIGASAAAAKNPLLHELANETARVSADVTKIAAQNSAVAGAVSGDITANLSAKKIVSTAQKLLVKPDSE